MIDKINISSPHFDVTRKTLDFIFGKAIRLNKTYSRIEDCNIVLLLNHDNKNKNKTAEITLTVPKQKLFAKDSAETFEAASALAVQELKRQLMKHKEKISMVKDEVYTISE